ncbi:MAG: winged helix-turn-helix transcriptional regulator [Anaerolineales bacterium]|nr:winged helix-turn-helix transcriptional regulator [Anaerolineales bacterium]
MLLAAQTTRVEIKARLFRGFSDPSRLKILESLRDGAQTVGAIVECTALSQSNVSNHLSCLRDCGLVMAEQRGKFVEYRLSDPRVEELLILAEILLADVAHGVYECTRYSTEERAVE